MGTDLLGTGADNKAVDTDPVKAFEGKVDELVSKATANDNGSLTFSDDVLKDVPTEVMVAAKKELRYRNTQSNYTRVTQENTKLSKVNERMAAEITENTPIHLTEEQNEELAALKTSDPEAWREKSNEYETAAKATLKQKLKDIETEGRELSEVEIRKAQIAAYAETTGITIDQKAIDDHMPPVWNKKLAEGKCTFDEYLEAAGKFIQGKVVLAGQDSEGNDTNLGEMSGGHEPSKQAQEGDITEQYNNAIF